uniref:MAPK regulated corepressor interacting protein 2 n=1 Tax=Fundulus heteroclitus TaxID=8078 RepID=A0A3Q2T841_FUNHE
SALVISQRSRRFAVSRVAATVHRRHSVRLRVSRPTGVRKPSPTRHVEPAFSLNDLHTNPKNTQWSRWHLSSSSKQQQGWSALIQNPAGGEPEHSESHAGRADPEQLTRGGRTRTRPRQKGAVWEFKAGHHCRTRHCLLTPHDVHNHQRSQQTCYTAEDSSPPPKIVFNRLNGKRHNGTATQKSHSPAAEGFTPAHEENVRFVYEVWQEVEQKLEDRGESADSKGPVQYTEKTPSTVMKNFVPIDLEEWWAQRFLANIANLS